jgi:hypothetical protein
MYVYINMHKNIIINILLHTYYIYNMQYIY